MGSASGRLLGLWVWIPPGAWMSVCCECCVLSGRGLCDGLFTPPEGSYRMWCVVVCDLESSWMRRPWPTVGCRAKNIFLINIIIFCTLFLLFLPLFSNCALSVYFFYCGIRLSVTYRHFCFKCWTEWSSAVCVGLLRRNWSLLTKFSLKILIISVLLF